MSSADLQANLAHLGDDPDELLAGIGAGGAVLGSLLAPKLGLILGRLAATAAGWGLRFRPGQEAVAWRRGRPGSGARLGCWPRWSSLDGWSCTTWPPQAARPTLTGRGGRGQV